MKTCLLCQYVEPGNTQPDPSVDFICSNCVQWLIKIPHHEMIRMYIQALKENHARKAYILKSFIPIAIRRKWKNHRRRKNITILS